MTTTAYVMLDTDRDAVVSFFEETRRVVIRVGGVSFYMPLGEAREVARQMIAVCDQQEAESINASQP